MQRRLLYTSLIAEDTQVLDVQRIVSSAQVHNRRRDITGVLAMGRRHFAQVLEGDAEIVERVVATISRDPRHTDVRVQLREDSGQRLFQRWDMALLHSETLDEALAHTHEGRHDPADLVAHLREQVSEDRR